MREELTWTVGGQQGEGIESTGDVLASGLNRLGYHLYGSRTFSSRIKGGHTNFRLRISRRHVRAPGKQVDVLVAFDRESVDRLGDELAGDGLVVLDGDGRSDGVAGSSGARTMQLPMSGIARELGSAIMKNMVGAGAAAALLGLDAAVFERVIADRFARKGDGVVQANQRAFQAGYERAFQGLDGDVRHRLAPGDGRRRYVMSGDEAAAFGALTAGCRVMAAYPITPASDIMHWLVGRLPAYGGVVVQTEDEIAAATLVTGAGYAGARAMTATSGPGFSLMMEALGYAGMIEAPIVIVDVQRAGPSTGLPTKHEQSDLLEMLYGSHGDMPRLVVAPGDVEECFYVTAEAFNLAERYQTPVIVAMDLAVGLCRETVDDLDFSRVAVDRGQLAAPADLGSDGDAFRRYRSTQTGVSPRSLPGMPGGLHLATGVEHDETGHITEDRSNRVRMMQKRLRKVSGAATDGGAVPPLTYAGPEDPELLLIGWGSSLGPLAEAREVLERAGVRAGHAHVRLLHPFPADGLRPRMARARQALAVENNARGQLARLIRQELDDASALHSLLKFDGTPFLVDEIVRECEAML